VVSDRNSAQLTERVRANHVHHHLGLKRSDPPPERPGRVLGRPIHQDLLNLRPRLILNVGSTDTPGQVDHLVPRADQPRHQEAADMSATADHHMRMDPDPSVVEPKCLTLVGLAMHAPRASNSGY
jgi:hypothetical protein